MRGALFGAWLLVRYPWTMLAIWTFRGLVVVDAEAAWGWWRISGMYARCRRVEAELEKISA